MCYSEINSNQSVPYKLINLWKYITISDVSRDFLGIPFSIGKFRAGGQKDIIVNFEQQFSVINIYGWHG